MDFENDIIKKEKKKKTKIITETSFGFDGDKIKYALKYQGNGTAPDKRFDTNCEGLCLFISPKEMKTFYAFKSRPMFNKEKDKAEKNAFYKKIFRYADVKGFKYRDAKNKLKETLDSIVGPVAKNTSQLLFKDLAKRFLKEGMDGPTLDNPELEYKAGTKVRYTHYIKSLLLLRHTKKDKIQSLTKTIIYKNKTSNKPIGDYPCSEITLWHIEVLRERLKDTPTTAGATIQVISIIFRWAIVNNIFKGDNPCKNFTWKQSKPFKAKLLDSDTAKLKTHIAGKAFDYEPHFLACCGLHLYLGQRSLDIFGLRWESPVSEEEKEACSGWLLDDWETARKPKLYLWDMKNRKGAKIHIDQDSLRILKRLKEANLRDRNSWALKSCYIFPQSKNPTKCVTYASYAIRMAKLNKILGFVKLEGDNIPRVKGKRKIFTFKIARKTFGTEVARNKGGVELASRKLNHSSPAVTRKNYIVPDDEEMEIENLYEKSLPNEDLLVVRKDKKSPWSDKRLIDKK
mgnify:CR=1 FL=1